MQHERPRQAVPSGERLERAGEWNRVLLPILWTKGLRLDDRQQSPLQVEPLRSGLDDLGLPQAGVETEEEDQIQIVRSRADNELVPQNRGAKLVPAFGSCRSSCTAATGLWRIFPASTSQLKKLRAVTM